MQRNTLIRLSSSRINIYRLIISLSSPENLPEISCANFLSTYVLKILNFTEKFSFKHKAIKFQRNYIKKRRSFLLVVHEETTKEK